MNLSEKLLYDPLDGKILRLKAVKEFIKEEEKLIFSWKSGTISDKEFWEERDKLIGPEINDADHAKVEGDKK